MNRDFMSSLFKKKELCETKFGLARVFKYRELKKATNSFATELGRGGYGKVYLGKLQDGQMVAVKALFDRDPKRLEHFFNEVTVLSRIRHKNLVSLCGCTNPTSADLLIVYEYVPNGTLADHLHGQQSALNWAARIRIAVEAAEALAYLHGFKPSIIHRDVKTSNILLDHAFHVKVADFDICRLLPWDTEHASTLPQGTMGYRDPEYERYFRLTDKTDVYSFGVVLMEIISGQQAVDANRDLEDVHLNRMAIRKIENNKLEELVDPRIGYHSNNDIRRMINSVAQLAAKCLQPAGITRPSMAQVASVLKEIQKEIEQPALNDVTALPEKEIQNEIEQPALNDVTALPEKEKEIQNEIEQPGLNDVTALRNFTFGEMMRATRNFWPHNVLGTTILGKGRLGKVFKGWVDEKSLNPVKSELGMVIAVKSFDLESMQRLNEWESNVQFIWRLSHSNLVKLLGYCRRTNELLLVSEFMAKGTLEEYLFRSESYENYTRKYTENKR